MRKALLVLAVLAVMASAVFLWLSRAPRRAESRPTARAAPHQATPQPATARRPATTPAGRRPGTSKPRAAASASTADPAQPAVKPMPAKASARPAPPPAPKPLDPEAQEKLDELIAEIRRGAPRLELTPRAQALLKALAGEQADVVAGLLAEARSQRPRAVVRNTIIIRALQHIGSDEAKAALLHLALTDDPTTTILEGRAAQAYVALTKDVAEIVKLLPGPEEAVKQVALAALKGASLDHDGAQAVASCTRSTTPLTHKLLAAALAGPGSAETAEAKVDALLASATRLHELERGDRPAYGSRWTEREEVVASYLAALAQMGEAEPILRRRRQTATAAQRELLVVVLAMRGARDIREPLLQVIQTTRDGFIRASAVEALGRVATKEDVPLLKKLASSDPFLRPDPHGSSRRTVADYPVRQAAARVLRGL